MNEAAARTLHLLMGRQRHDLLGRAFWIALPEFVGTDAEEQLRRAQRERIPVHFDTHIERVGAWFETHAYPSEEGLSIYFRDVSERARSELSVRLLAEAGAILAGSPDHRASLQAVARLSVPALADVAFVDLVEGDRIDRLAVVHRDPAHRADADRLRALPVELDDPDSPVARVIRTGQPELLQSTFPAWPQLRGEKAELAERLGISSILVLPLSARGRTLGALTFAHGHTGRRFDQQDMLLGQELARRCALVVDAAHLYTEAQDAIGNRDEVLAIVAHDLRNPLTSIVAHTRMLARKAPADDAGAPIHKGADAIRRSSERMERLIDDLLDAALLQKGRLTLVRTPEEPASILQELEQNFAPVAEEQRIELQTEAAQLPAVSCDRGRVLQVLGNFLGNALRVTRAPGKVAVFVQDVPGAVRFCVRDTGPGIPEEQRQRIFERYFRGRTDAYRGAGLGLAISRGIVEAHGGAIGVDSVEGEGSTFWFTLPVASTDHASSTSA